MKTMTKLMMLLVLLAFCLPADGEILIYTKTMKCFGAEGTQEIDSPVIWDWVGDERVVGFLILDVLYEDGEIVWVWDAEQVEYWREGRERFYEQWEEGYGVERIEVPGRTELAPPIVWWVLENWWLDEGIGVEDAFFVMHRGKARPVNIGLGWAPEEKREAASVLQGCMQYYWEWLDEVPEPDVWEIEKGTCCVTLRLDAWRTRMANLYWAAYDEDEGDGWTWDPFEWAIGGIAPGPYLIDGALVGAEDEPFGIVKGWLEWLGYTEVFDMPMMTAE